MHNRISIGKGVRVAVTDRFGGSSAPPFHSCNLDTDIGDDLASVGSNRLGVAHALGLDPGRVIYPEIDPPDTVYPVAGIDAGMVTAEAGTALAVLSADRLPVVLADGDAGVVAASLVDLAGPWPGDVARVLAAMLRLGASLDSTVAFTGPAICARCHRVDIRAGAMDQLQGLGIERIWYDERCTGESDTLYSTSREGATGRFGTFVWLA
jgi:copper oxidase (laccase) domain-containing protein